MKISSIVLISVFLLSCGLKTPQSIVKTNPVKVIQHATDASSIFTNAYILELENSLVVIDATLTVTAAKVLRSKVDSLAKPLIGVFITHGHPDHYNGLGYLTDGLDVNIYSTQGVLDVIKESDASKEAQWTPMFGDEWPKNRKFPNTILESGKSITIDEVLFTIESVGPGESHHDSFITVHDGSQKIAFVGDIVLHKVHAYVADGHLSDWMQTLRNMGQKLKGYDMIYPGHGSPGNVGLFDWQLQYLDIYIEEVKSLLKDQQRLTDDDKEILTARMQKQLDNDKLLFLVGLGADSVVDQIINKQI